jgi:hypothetical protein
MLLHSEIYELKRQNVPFCINNGGTKVGEPEHKPPFNKANPEILLAAVVWDPCSGVEEYS